MPLLCFVLCLLHEVLPDLLPWHFLKDRPCAAPLIAISLICMWLFHYNSLNLSSHVARATESRFARWLAHSGAVVQTLAFLGPALAMRLPAPPQPSRHSPQFPPACLVCVNSRSERHFDSSIAPGELRACNPPPTQRTPVLLILPPPRAGNLWGSCDANRACKER